MVTCQSANQLKTPAKVSWAFKMVSQFGSVGYTIMGKTADLTVVQKTIIETLHKEGKPQTCIAKEVGFHRVLYPSMLTESWVEEKDAQPTERTTALWGLSSKIDSRIWVNFTSNELRLGSRHQEPPHTDVSRNLATVVIRGVLPGLRRRRTGLLLSGPKSSFQMRASFVFHLETQGPRVWRKGGEAHSPSCLKSSVKFPQSVMVWGAMSSAALGPMCFLKTNVTAPIYQEISKHFMLPSADQFFKDADSFSSRIWPCPHWQKHQKLVTWPWCWCAWLTSKLTRPEPHRETMGYCQEENEKQETKTCRWAEGHCQRNLGFHTTSAVPQTDHLHATPNWGSN